MVAFFADATGQAGAIYSADAAFSSFLEEAIESVCQLSVCQLSVCQLSVNHFSLFSEGPKDSLGESLWGIFHFSLFTIHTAYCGTGFSFFTIHFSLFTFHFSLFTFHFSFLCFTLQAKQNTTQLWKNQHTNSVYCWQWSCGHVAQEKRTVKTKCRK